jgi:hypothetical protein
MDIIKFLERRNASPALSKLSILEMQNSKAGKEANEFFNEFMNFLLENKSLEEKNIAFEIIFNQPFLNLNSKEEWFDHWQKISDWAEMSLMEMRKAGGDAETFANLFFKFLFPENQELFKKLLFPRNTSKVLIKKKTTKILEDWLLEKAILDNGKNLNSAEFRKLGSKHDTFYKKLLRWLKETFPEKDAYEEARKKIYGKKWETPLHIPLPIPQPKEKKERAKTGNFPWSNFSRVEEWKNYRQEELDDFECLIMKELFVSHELAKSFYDAFLNWTNKNYKREIDILKARDIVFPLGNGTKREYKQKRPRNKREKSKKDRKGKKRR